MQSNILKRATLTVTAIAVAAIVATLAGIIPAPVYAVPDPAPTTCSAAAAAGLLAIPPAGKVTLCHFTGSGSNPFIINQPSLSAADNHEGHHGDCARYADGHIQCGL